MIIGLLHPGSGIGNQLARYVMTRVLALDKGYDFSMAGEFKGQHFMKLDKGQPLSYGTHVELPAGKLVVDCDLPLFQEDTSDYDWRVKDVEDNTIVDGEFQGEEYFEHRLPEIREWLAVEPLEMADDLCVINFRGGEYKYVPSFFLPQSYWAQGIKMMREINPNMRFEVHTDDLEEAQKFFPDFPVFQDMALNWRAIRYAKYLIISNSSFAIIPALLNEEVKKVIAPKGWALRNTGGQSLKYNVYKKFTHI